MKASSHNSSASLSSFSMTVPAWVVAIVILVLGATLGYLFHGSSRQTVSNDPNNANQSTGFSASSQTQLPFDATIQPLLDSLKTDPNDAELLINIGNRYYDNHDWGKAVEYYRKSLDIKPEDVNVRTDMGTAIWYGGDADGAIREYKISLQYQPNHPQTLFNMGVVKWQGEHDDSGALQSWQKLLSVDPAYPDRAKVEQMMQQVQTEMKQSAETSSAQ